MRQEKQNTRHIPHLLAHERPEALGVQPVLVHVVRVGAAVTTRARHTLRVRQQQAAAAAGRQAGITSAAKTEPLLGGGL
jgi:hypothetical protein